MKRSRGAVLESLNADVKKFRSLRGNVGPKCAAAKSVNGNAKALEPLENVYVKSEVTEGELQDIIESVGSSKQQNDEPRMAGHLNLGQRLTRSQNQSLRSEIDHQQKTSYNSRKVINGELEHVAVKEEPLDSRHQYQLSSEADYLQCCICSYTSRHLSSLLKHYTSAHEHEPNFIVTCGINDCISSYSVVAALRRHINRKHKKEIEVLDEMDDEEIEADDRATDNGHLSESNMEPLDAYIDEITACVLQISEKYRISKQTSAAIVEKFEGLINRCIEDTNDAIEINSLNLTPEQKSLLMYPLIKLSESLAACNTVQKQVMLFEKYGLVCPDDMHQGDREAVSYRPPNGTFQAKENDLFSEAEPVYIESPNMGQYFIEYKNRRVLFNHDGRKKFIHSAIQELKKHGIIVPSEDCRLELYDKNLDIYYCIKEKDLPGHGLVRLISDCNRTSIHSRKGQVTTTSNLQQLPPSLDAILTQNEDDDNMSVNEYGEYGVRSWPKQFVIKDRRISDPLKKSLESKLIPSKKEQSALLEFLYKEITRYTYYPTPRNYDEVATALLRKFPHLQECSSFDDAKELWKIRLSTKARNSRRRKDQSLPVVVEKRAKRETSVGENVNSNKSKPGYGAPNYLPKKPTSVDDASIEQHINFLKRESEKNGNRDLKGIEISMGETFHHRRELIVLQNTSIPALKKVYPMLFDSMQLCSEFLRITEIDIITVMRAKLMEYADGILEVSSTPYKKNNSLNLDTQKELWACAAISKIPVLMKETLDFTVVSEVPSPMVVFESLNLRPTTRGKLVARGEEICTFEGPLMGMAVWLASYYSFDCCYPKSCSKTLRFLQRAMLGLKDATKAHVTVMSMFHKIKQAKIVANRSSDQLHQ